MCLPMRLPSTTRLGLPPVSGDVQGMARREQGWNGAGLLGLARGSADSLAMPRRR